MSMYYTSYYGNLKKLGKIIPIGISRSVPRFVQVKRCMALAPSWELMKAPEEEYEPLYKELLSRLNPFQVLEQIERMADRKPFALLCYEKPNEFCHRHLVAKWLEDSTGIQICEFGVETNSLF